MKKSLLLAVAVTLLASAAIAAEPAPAPKGQPGPKFAEHKQKVLDHIAQRIQKLQAAQTCIQNAQDIAAIKACREQAKEGAAKE